MKQYLWMAVTEDKYELPIAVSDTCAELARKVGRENSTVKSLVSRSLSKGGKCKYIKVEIDDCLDASK